MWRNWGIGNIYEENDYKNNLVMLEIQFEELPYSIH